MMGIIATIIAARKRHYTFAWVIGIWTAIAIILALCGMARIAIAPGWVFLFIAIGMKKVPEERINDKPLETPIVDCVQEGIPSAPTTSAPSYVSLEPSVTQNDDFILTERSSPDPAVIRFCRYCGQELELGAKFCRHCGAQIE